MRCYRLSCLSFPDNCGKCHALHAECRCAEVKAEMERSITARNDSRDAERAKKKNGGDKREKYEKKAKLIDTRKRMKGVDRKECTKQGKCPYFQAGVC